MNNSHELLRSAPYFPVTNVDRVAEYYESALGFQREYAAGSPTQFAIMSRDGLPVMLRLVADRERISPNANQGGTWDVFFWVRDARALHAEFSAHGATVVYAPRIEIAYNMEEFAVRDPEGYVLGFGQALAVTAEPLLRG
jgi:predicted enzyme related to lactoylglutathione lyase